MKRSYLNVKAGKTRAQGGPSTSGLVKSILVGAALLAVPAANAAPVTLIGDTINYVYDDSQAGLALFGAPTIIGDVVRFLPTGFRAQSTNGSGFSGAFETFVFDRIFTRSGADIRSVQLSEAGSYRIFGDGVVTADLSLLASNNTGGAEFVQDTDSLFASGASSLALFSLDVDLDINNTFGSPANDIALSIGNGLTATTTNVGDAAFVQKNLAFTAVSQVPLPAAAWLFGSAVAALLVARRKR